MSEIVQAYQNFPVITWLVLISGIFWMIVYVDAARIGFRDKIHAMPTAALALNLCWEAWYSYIFFTKSSWIQGGVNLLWCLLDLAILFTFIKFGRKEFSELFNERYFTPWVIFLVIMAVSIVVGSYYNFIDTPVPGIEGMEQLTIGNYGCWYVAFAQNLLMSALYLRMLFDRGSRRGQSMTIAVSKCLGTLAPTITFGFLLGNLLIAIVGLLCFVLDVAYIVLLTRPEFQRQALTTAQSPSTKATLAV